MAEEIPIQNPSPNVVVETVTIPGEDHGVVDELPMSVEEFRGAIEAMQGYLDPHPEIRGVRNDMAAVDRAETNLLRLGLGAETIEAMQGYLNTHPEIRGVRNDMAAVDRAETNLLRLGLDASE